MIRGNISQAKLRGYVQIPRCVELRLDDSFDRLISHDPEKKRESQNFRLAEEGFLTARVRCFRPNQMRTPEYLSATIAYDTVLVNYRALGHLRLDSE